MTSCRRGCCLTGLGVCYRQRACACHALDTPRTEPRGSDARPYRNPTEDQAIRNVMRERKGKPR